VSTWDDEPNFELACARQAERANLVGIPKACLNPLMLQYKVVGSLGQQVRRAMDTVLPDQLLIVLFDDFRASPRDVYHRVISLLGLPDDNRSEFPAVNEAMTQTLKRTLKGPFYKLADQAKKSMSLKNQGKGELNQDFRVELTKEFSAEVSLLEELLGRDLSSWTLHAPRP